MSESTEPVIVHNAAASRFETKVNGLLCVASYHLHNGVMDMVHTGVPPALEGGIAGRLVAAALDHARRRAEGAAQLQLRGGVHAPPPGHPGPAGALIPWRGTPRLSGLSRVRELLDAG
jgi:predicted GNAT family acetyltransferase